MTKGIPHEVGMSFSARKDAEQDVPVCIGPRIAFGDQKQSWGRSTAPES